MAGPTDIAWPQVPAAKWLPYLVELARRLIQAWPRKRHDGAYEVLRYASTLELLDTQGVRAKFQKQLRVRFLQDYIIAFEDFAWGDGEVLVDYRCAPGVVVDTYRDADRWNVLISLHETKRAGEVEDFYITRTVKHGFRQQDEWWQVEMQHPTDALQVSLIFPKGRHCRQAVLREQHQNRATLLDASHFTDLPDGRQVLRWETTAPQRFEMYTLQWRW